MSQERILEILPDNQDEGLSVEEIAEALNMPPSTVRNQLYRLRRQNRVLAARYSVKGK
jgi:DNA-binding IclR family transcriptional regulator